MAVSLIKHLERLWEEPPGFLAMALAALQASSAIVLLWGMGFAKPPKVGLRTLLRERPLLTQTFLGLTLTLSALAAFRAAKVAVGPSWVLSMCISAALSLVLPAILGLTSHYALEATADCLALAKVLIVIAFIGFGLGTVVALWTLTLLLVLSRRRSRPCLFRRVLRCGCQATCFLPISWASFSSWPNSAESVYLKRRQA